jgi:hypothetical protein
MLGKECFSVCRLLSTVEFEDGSKLKKVEDQAFSRCSSLKSFCIPRMVEYLGDGCFQDCKCLDLVIFEFGSELTHLGWMVFFGCDRLRGFAFRSLDGIRMMQRTTDRDNIMRVITENRRVAANDSPAEATPS